MRQKIKKNYILLLARVNRKDRRYSIIWPVSVTISRLSFQLREDILDGEIIFICGRFLLYIVLKIIHNTMVSNTHYSCHLWMINNWEVYIYTSRHTDNWPPPRSGRSCRRWRMRDCWRLWWSCRRPHPSHQAPPPPPCPPPHPWRYLCLY